MGWLALIWDKSLIFFTHHSGCRWAMSNRIPKTHTLLFFIILGFYSTSFRNSLNDCKSKMNLRSDVQCPATCALVSVDLVELWTVISWTCRTSICLSIYTSSHQLLVKYGQEQLSGVAHYLAVWKLPLVFQQWGSRGGKRLRLSIRDKVVSGGKRCCVLWQGALFVYTQGQACGRACEASAGSRVYLGAFIVASSLVRVGMRLGLIRDSAPPSLRVVSRDSVWAWWAWRPAQHSHLGSANGSVPWATHPSCCSACSPLIKTLKAALSLVRRLFLYSSFLGSVVLSCSSICAAIGRKKNINWSSLQSMAARAL